MPGERILFVTGRLAEASVRKVVAHAAPSLGIEYDVEVLPISVAALMHTGWVRHQLRLTGRFDRVLLPGWCQGDLNVLTEAYNVPFERGPKDIRDLPEFFGGGDERPDLSRYDIEILAEINHAPRLADRAIVDAARHYRDSGADVIDLGGIPGESWPRCGDVTRLLRREGFRVSIDSFERAEVEAAVEAGADIVLSANSTNLEWVSRLNAELIAIPDAPDRLESLAQTIDVLRDRSCRFRIDPIIEPIGLGFAQSLQRYYEARRRWPDLPILMGAGNVTEMCDADSAAVNLLLAAICQELGIGSVLLTEVINWARSSVQEFDLARRLVKYAVEHRVPAKHVDPRLVLLRDPQVHEYGAQELLALAARLTDPNFRIFVERGEIHVMNRDGYWRGTDPFELFDRFSAATALDASHAFYLGYELSKAVTALTLTKQYTQDQPLQWGFLTRAEPSAHERRRADRNAPGA